MLTKKEEMRIEKCLLDFFRIHKELSNCDANVQMIMDEANRLLLPLDNPETLEICLLSCGSRLAKVEQHTPPAIEESPVRVVNTEKVLEEMEEQPSYDNTKEELRAMIRRQAERKLAASQRRESIRQNNTKSSVNPAQLMREAMGGEIRGEK